MKAKECKKSGKIYERHFTKFYIIQWCKVVGSHISRCGSKENSLPKRQNIFRGEITVINLINQWLIRSVNQSINQIVIVIVIKSKGNQKDSIAPRYFLCWDIIHVQNSEIILRCSNVHSFIVPFIVRISEILCSLWCPNGRLGLRND